MKRRGAASPSDEKRREALVLHGVEDELETLDTLCCRLVLRQDAAEFEHGIL